MSSNSILCRIMPILFSHKIWRSLSKKCLSNHACSHQGIKHYTTQLYVVFDASVNSRSDVSLNDQLLVRPKVHASVVDILLSFHLHNVALTTEVARMYWAVLLSEDHCDLQCFIWRKGPQDSLTYYTMTRLTFEVSASSFAANYAIKWNALLHQHSYPLAAPVVQMSFLCR